MAEALPRIHPYEFNVLKNDRAELVAVANLLAKVFPSDSRFSIEYLNWLYCDNPAGKAVGVNAYSGQDLVAHYVTVPFEARLFGKPCRGVWSLNTATDPLHQGKGLFTALAERTYQRAAELGFQFVIGVANANSTPGFTKKLGFQLVSPLHARVGIGLPSYLLDQPEPEFSRIWDQHSLHWRLARPKGGYSIRGKGDALCVYVHSGKFGISALLYRGQMNFLKPEHDNGIRLSPLTLYIGLDPSIAWKNSYYINIPTILKPSPLNLIYRNFFDSASTLDRSNALVNALDFDAY